MKKSKIANVLGFIATLYFFVFSLTLIKVSSASLGEAIFSLTRNEISEINAFGFGWLASLVTQSSGAAAATLIIFNLAGVIGPVILIYMIIGTRIGTSITALFVAFLVHAKRRDFRHGFEIGLANLVYAVPVAIIMLLVEFFTGFFYKTGNYFMVFDSKITPNFVEWVISPIINLISFIPDKINLLLGIFILIISLKNIPKFMINIWGEDYLKGRINKFLGKKWKSFMLGMGVTALLMSTSITITFLIPLIVTRITKLKKVIPYMIGANLGGVSEIVLGGIVLGGCALPAVFTYVSFSVIGLLWMLNIDLLWKTTKFISKKTLHISRKRALVFIIIFVLMAVILSFI
jgi:solute carrier family 34 (sodium-dependent phosphate cotransporter)